MKSTFDMIASTLYPRHGFSIGITTSLSRFNPQPFCYAVITRKPLLRFAAWKNIRVVTKSEWISCCCEVAGDWVSKRGVEESMAADEDEVNYHVVAHGV